MRKQFPANASNGALLHKECRLSSRQWSQWKSRQRWRQSEKGWGVGRHVYRVLQDNGVVDGEQLAIACSHQDQVIEAPNGALTILSSDFTPHAGLLYANGTTLTVQPHPEFDLDFAHVCCELRQGKAPDAVVAAAKASLAEPLDSAKLGGAITRFLVKRAAP